MPRDGSRRHSSSKSETPDDELKETRERLSKVTLQKQAKKPEYDPDSDSDCEEFARKQFSLRSQQFTLSPLKIQVLCDTLERPKGSGKTSTCRWNKSSSGRTAVYKLLKVARWHLLDESMIFDPLLCSYKQDLPHSYVDEVCGVRQSEDAKNTLQIYSMSVDMLLQKFLTDSNIQILMRIDKALAGIDLSSEQNPVELDIDSISQEIRTHIGVASNSFLLFASSVHHILTQAETSEIQYTAIFQQFFQGILEPLAEQGKTGFRASWTTLKGQKYEMFLRNLLVTSEADLYILSENFSYGCPVSSLAAVVEVKGQDRRGNIVASSCTTPSCSTGQSCSSQDVDDDDDDCQEDAVDYDIVEDCSVQSAPNEILRRMSADEKLPLRQFLPQLLGEMMCTFKLNISQQSLYHGSYRLGIAVTGFKVRFVGMIIDHEEDQIARSKSELLDRTPLALQYIDKLRTVVFITRPLDILTKKDRRIIVKTLVCSAFLFHPQPVPERSI